VARIRVPRKGVTQAELAAVLSRRLGGGYQVEPDGDGRVVVRRSPLATAVVRIRDVPGATVFRVRGGGLPLYRHHPQGDRRAAPLTRISQRMTALLPECRPGARTFSITL